MNDSIHQENDSNRRKDRKRGQTMKGFMKTVGVGVLSSAITLTAVTYFPLQKEEAASTSVQQQTADGTDTASNLNVQKVSNPNNSLADTIDEASKAIVGIVNYQSQNNPFNQTSGTVAAGTGSGVIFEITDDGAYIVTNNHVIEGGKKLEVSLYDGTKVDAELVGTDSLTDIAVIKIKGDYSIDPIPFGDSSQLRAGDSVLAIGNPLGLDLSRTVTQGIVSAVERAIDVDTSAGSWELNVIQTDAAINPGNSGGALITADGKLVGINSLKIADSGVEGLGFAIPINDVQKIIDQLIDHGKIVRPYLGVGLASLSEVPSFYLQNLPKSLTGGAIVSNVDTSSGAATAGLKVGDVIVSIGGQKVEDATDLRKYLYTEASAGDKVEIEYYRDGQLNKATVTLSDNGSKE